MARQGNEARRTRFNTILGMLAGAAAGSIAFGSACFVFGLSDDDMARGLCAALAAAMGLGIGLSRERAQKRSS